MQKTETMTLDEIYAIGREAFALLDAGDREGYMRLSMSIPLPPYLAKIAKEKVGMDFLLSGWNLADAEAEFGPGWIDS